MKPIQNEAVMATRMWKNDQNMWPMKFASEKNSVNLTATDHGPGMTYASTREL